MDRRGCAALEHRAGKRRDLAVGGMVGKVVVVNTKARERVQIIGVSRARQHVERFIVVRLVGDQEQVREHVRSPAGQADVEVAVEAGADRNPVGVQSRNLVERRPRELARSTLALLS